MKGFLIAVLLACSLGAHAQETINYASLGGRVSDPSGGVIADAQVTARQIETNLRSAQSTDAAGRFRFPYLHVGQYEITIHKTGFSDSVETITVTVGAAFDLAVALKIGTAESKVTVTGEAPVLEAARSEVAGTIADTEVRELPLNGRNLMDLALLVPGVSPTNTAAVQLFAETSAIPGQGISVSSQRNFSNSFIVDGVSANDDAAGVAGTFYGLDVVDEFQVVTSGGQAEFGRAMGGYINIVTKGGSNTFHGAIYGYFRNQRFNANNALLAAKLPMTAAQDGASLGGPILKDRTFFFTNYEGRDLNQTGLITILPANVAAINARLTAAGYKGAQISTGIYPNPVHLRNFLAKVDHQFSAKDQFSVRFSLYDVDSNNSRGAGALSAVSAAAGLNNIDQTVAISNIYTISSRTVNETRGQFTYSSLLAPANDSIGPAVSISGVASFGTLSGSPTGRLNKLSEVVDNISYRAGAHAFRAGVDFLYNGDTITFPRTIRGSYSFSSLANFLSGTYNSSGYTQTFGNSVIHQTNPNIGFYAQDEWKVTPTLTLNTGLRYDLEWLQTLVTQKDNVSPRAGFAWSPWGSRRWVVRGNFGIFYDRIPLRPLANALLSSDNTTTITSTSQLSLSLSSTQTGAPVFPNILASVPTGVLSNLSTMDHNMQHAYSEQGSLEIERQLGARSAITVGYQDLRARHLIISVNQNVPSCTAVGANNGCRPVAAYANDSQYSPWADSQYDGLQVSFVQRPVKWGSYRISYSFSHALDDVSEFFFSAPMNNFNILQDWARSDDDQRHRVSFDGTIHTPMDKASTPWKMVTNGFQLSGALQYYSALPFNITAGSNTIQGTGARPTIGGAYIGRNLGRGFDFFNVSMRLSRTFPVSERLHLELMAEVFNALNHTNDMIPNGTFGSGTYPTTPSATFGTPGAVGDPRGGQFALRVTF
jgi:hypothetical protein